MRNSFRAITDVRIVAKNHAQDRLENILSSRTSKNIVSDSNQIIYEPPPETFRPIVKIAVGAVLVAVVLVWLNRPQVIATPEVLQSGVAVAASSAPGITSGSELVVDVEGLVNAPGLVRLPAGSRVADAIAAAGGLSSADASGSINLAQLVTDGQLISVGVTTAGSGDTRINLNSASVAELDTLPGVGPVMADRIIAWRESHKKFSSIDELQEVPGIGPKVFANLKELIVI